MAAVAASSTANRMTKPQPARGSSQPIAAVERGRVPRCEAMRGPLTVYRRLDRRRIGDPTGPRCGVPAAGRVPAAPFPARFRRVKGFLEGRWARHVALAALHPGPDPV